MCGIFGYVGPRSNAAQIVLEGLKRLDYRGYDSWGVAVVNDHHIHLHKETGILPDQPKVNLPTSSLGIAHTRWATTGSVTQANAHPHYSTDKTFVLAQNGIVENFTGLKDMLISEGYQFESETDTEVIVRLIERQLKSTPNFQQALVAAFKQLQGRNTIIVLNSQTQDIFAARNGSPLVVGLNPHTQETFLSSDTLSFSQLASQMIVVDNHQLVHVNGKVSLYDLDSNQLLNPKVEPIDTNSTQIDKNHFDHFMLKEIFDTPEVITNLLNQNQNAFDQLAKAIKSAANVYTIGSGTAGIAAAQISFYLRQFGQIKSTPLVGADAHEYLSMFGPKDLLIAPSQSGETADVLEVLEHAKSKGAQIASFVNMPGSMMTRISDYKFLSLAGPEICVMSTKVFTSQVAWGYLVAKTIQNQSDKGRQNLLELSHTISSYLKSPQVHQQINQLASLLLPHPHIFLLGKSQNYQITREGMVKIIEGSYKHAHAIPAGDLKHYAITLMEPNIPVVAVISDDEVKSDVFNAVHEVKARGAFVIGVSPHPDPSFDFHLPAPNTSETSAIGNVIPLQLLAYHLAVLMGNNVDKPRNIAKSVTVK